MKSLTLRVLVVAFVASAIVGAGFGLKQIDSVNAYFQKPPPPDGAAGEAEHQGKSSEAKSGNDAPTVDAAARTEEKDESFERWPALELQDVAHTGRITLPVLALVLVVDTARRRRYKQLRIPARPPSGRPGG